MTESKSKYTYCIVDAAGTDTRSLGTGIDDEPVSVVVQDDIGAVVHSCSPQAYDTDDRSKAETWVKQHNETIERAGDAFGTPLPMTFDTIFADEDALRTFLDDHKEQIGSCLGDLAGTSEYGVRIYCEEDVLIGETEPADETGSSDSSGMAYFERKKREKQRRQELAERTKERFQSYFPRIEAVVDEIMEEDLDRESDERGRNVLTASCLVADGEVAGLKQALSEIDAEPGIEVVFTGPWHPYSFVGSFGTTASPTDTDGT
ncbi:gas vesicle protein GvpL [Natronococcus occultus]|uniref:Gas vesicle synthesis protein GvpL/GvpF n=1 Tax=Natronococcus occultus SP4 TaxID=694430 RepID=L0K6V4_9EURY|nr:GvpL/GvpF family gas vesicle protein [Natronococcus occultus]AGB39843.1 Gas vesicle synthesis protein GvpL/GvpF [Natronococcus occultus SP4]